MNEQLLVALKALDQQYKTMFEKLSSDMIAQGNELQAVSNQFEIVSAKQQAEIEELSKYCKALEAEQIAVSNNIALIAKAQMTAINESKSMETMINTTLSSIRNELKGTLEQSLEAVLKTLLTKQKSMVDSLTIQLVDLKTSQKTSNEYIKRNL